MSEELSQEIGEIISGKLSEGLEVKLLTSIEKIKMGMPCLISTDNNEYYCVVSDILINTDAGLEGLLGTPLERSMRKLRDEHRQFMSQLRSSIKLNVLRKIDHDGSIFPFDTMPELLSKCVPMKDEVFEKIYEVNKDLVVGHLRDFPKYEVSINLDNLIDTSFGIFGATGSGKSIFMKILLSRLIKNHKCSNLVIDSMGEYGYISPDGMVGIKMLFPNDVVLFSLDAKNKEKDRLFRINPNNMDIGDLQTIMKNLTDVMQYALLNIDKLKNKKTSLVDAILSPPPSLVIHEGTLAGLQSRLSAILSFDFFDTSIDKSNDSLEQIKQFIVDEHKTVVVDLGKYRNNENAYFIIATLLARFLYDEYSDKDENKDYPNLVVVLEEAHKYIDYAIWNRIARQMRKNNMILAIIDQIPDSINEDVLSQLHNRFIFKLNRVKDIKSSLEGVDQSHEWSNIISTFPLPRSLNPRRSMCFACGDSIPIPTVLEVLDYNKEVLEFQQQEITTVDVKKSKKSVL